MEIFKFDRYENENNRDFIYRSLKESIIRATIKPGEAISEPKLQQIFNVSRSPIREAISVLDHEGLVEVQPKKKTRVVLIDYQQIIESRFLRCIAEKEVLVNMCNTKDTKPLADKLDKILDEAESKYKNNENFRTVIFDYDNMFHSAIFEYNGFSFVWKILRLNNIQYNRFLNLYLEEQLYGDFFIKDHREVAQNIRNKEVDKLVSYTQKNYERIEGYLKKLVLIRPDYFTCTQN